MIKANSLSINNLTCKIPNYDKHINQLISKKDDDELYKQFINKLFSCIPIDYKIDDKFEPFVGIAGHTFKFIQNRIENKRKISFGTDVSGLKIMLLHEHKQFVIDALISMLSRLNLQVNIALYPLLYCLRDTEGNLKKILDKNSNSIPELLVYIEVLGNFDQNEINILEHKIHDTLDQVDSINISWPNLLYVVDDVITYIMDNNKHYTTQTMPSAEILEFFHWIKQDNFSFLGSIEFDVSSPNSLASYGASSIWENNKEEIRNIIELSSSQVNQNTFISFGKINCVSPIRDNYLIDYILIKKIDNNGKYCFGSLLLGFYGSAIYYQSIKDIPILRQKLQFILNQSGFIENSYNTKKLKVLFEAIPRELLIQIDEHSLYCMCLHILSGTKSKELKVFIQNDWSNSFVNILIFMPLERFTQKAHKSIRDYLANQFNGRILSNYVTHVAQNYVYLSFTLNINVDYQLNISFTQIKDTLNKLSINWVDSLYNALYKKFGEYQENINVQMFQAIFPEEYKEKFDTSAALIDFDYLIQINGANKVLFNLSAHGVNFLLKVYSNGTKLRLSDILPLLESLGFIAIDSQTFNINAYADMQQNWIYEFTLSIESQIKEDIALFKPNIEKALEKMYVGLLPIDALSKLIALEGLNWYQIKLLKALSRYLHQTSFIYNEIYVKNTLVKHHKYSLLLIKFFEAKFHPVNHSDNAMQEYKSSILHYLDSITSSAEDKVMRYMLQLIDAMLRTNYYQCIDDSDAISYISFKFRSEKVPGLPLPLPYAEIFVYSNDFEGIHLRGGKVARGGLRWSDRTEDYRTEVLGLMKAQVTKNSVIVPTGAKGGFVALFQRDDLTYQDYIDRVVECYKNFLRGMLDITDNIINKQVVHPENTVIYDDGDPYLVVAADKGTATFSDYANNISNEYNFWLGDAFASGGSDGYDHKKMGITARGAWISAQNHFAEIGIDIQKQPVTVLGIGDMSGDVFGNGMLISSAIKLVAAFNHMHIFIDPNPDPKISFQERKRLFNLPRSKWSDYNKDLISAGGGIFDRNAKFINISPEMKKVFQITEDQLASDNFIKMLLIANIDLIWNGGIGTYIKASTESNIDIGDKANDMLRVNANDVQAKVIAEGGNLGISQLGRIEYGKSGGRINTDFIDNSAGVDCSDHEVNIKVVLNQAICDGKLTINERNKLLSTMTSEVQDLVLIDNNKQTQAITISQLSPALTVEIFNHLLSALEQDKMLDREVEHLPSELDLNKRALANEIMTRPELALLLSYSKMSVYKDLINAELINDQYFDSYLINYFPKLMHDRFREEILMHPLKEEIIATVITNKIVNQLGGVLINTIVRETGAAICDIARSYTIVCEIFNLDYLWNTIESLPSTVDNHIKIDMFTELAKLMRRGTAWFIRNLEYPINITQTIEQFKQPAQRLSSIINTLLLGEAKIRFKTRMHMYVSAGLDKDFANSVATLESLVSAFDIIWVTRHTGMHDTEVASLYFKASNQFHIDWLRKACEAQINNSYWNRLSIQSLKDDLYDKQRRLLTIIVNQSKGVINLQSWVKKHQKYIKIFSDFIDHIKESDEINLNMIILANKKFEMFLRKLL